jgi:hypothetical protein
MDSWDSHVSIKWNEAIFWQKRGTLQCSVFLWHLMNNCTLDLQITLSFNRVVMLLLLWAIVFWNIKFAMKILQALILNETVTVKRANFCIPKFIEIPNSQERKSAKKTKLLSSCSLKCMLPSNINKIWHRFIDASELEILNSFITVRQHPHYHSLGLYVCSGAKVPRGGQHDLLRSLPQSLLRSLFK